MLHHHLLLTAIFLLLICSEALAFSYRGQLEGESTGPTNTGEAIAWHQRQVTMGLNFGPEWDNSARLALNQWNEAGADFQWHATGNSAEPCQNDNINSTGWSDTTCSGGDWGSIVATTRVSMRKIGGTWYINDTDVIFNSGLQFDSYAGPQRYDNQGKPIYDFVRVALHEFGHAAGLLHPDEMGQHVDSIMNTGGKSLALDHLQTDDIQGIRQLYSDSDIPDITLEGLSSYEIQDGQITIIIDALRNYRNFKSGHLTLEIRADSSNDKAGYYVLGSIELGSLDASEWRNIGEISADYTPPPEGQHNVTLALMESEHSAPVFRQAIGYLEVSSDTVNSGTLGAVSANRDHNAGGGGGTSDMFILFALTLILGQRLVVRSVLHS